MEKSSITPSAATPVIVAGMHRSGTTLLSRMLQEAGVFMGTPRGKGTEEARFFNKLNRWLFHQVHARWDYPDPWGTLDPHRIELLTQAVAWHMRSLSCIRYLGPAKWLRYRSLHRINISWGWKDPRNTFTAPLWKALFPDARILLICRHPSDVVESVRKRELPQKTYMPTLKDRFKATLLTGRCRYAGRPHLTQRAGAFSLWKSYVRQGLRLQKIYGKAVCLIHYEDLVADPAATWLQVVRFLQLPKHITTANQAGEVPDPNRKLAFTRSAEAVAFYKQIRDEKLVRQLGYDNTTGFS